MMKRRDLQRIESKEREWDLAIRAFKRRLVEFWKLIKHQVKLDIKHMVNFMMYYKKPKDKFGLVWHTGEWWLIIIGIFFALKGIWGW